MQVMSKKGDPSNKRARETDDIDVVVDDNNPPLTIPHIQERIRQLLARLPSKVNQHARLLSRSHFVIYLCLLLH
jgi:hypothetical protein